MVKTAMLSPAAVARQLGVSPSTAKRWMQRGDIEAVRDRRGWLFADARAVRAFRRRRRARTRTIIPQLPCAADASAATQAEEGGLE